MEKNEKDSPIASRMSHNYLDNVLLLPSRRSAFSSYVSGQHYY